jgi:hypothetical protein
MENFDGLAYGPNREETVFPRTDVWTNVPPAGWVKDDTQVPGYNNPDLPPPAGAPAGPGNEDNNGVTEWIGWTFANRDWWVQAAGDQRRVEFTKAHGGVMVADNDEWDDAMHPPQTTSPDDPKFQTEEDLYNAFITTAPIPIAGAKPGTYNIEFDSSWRPEGFDDGTEINNQTGIVEAIYSDGTTQELMHWDSDPTGPYFHDHKPNEHVTFPLDVPEGATSVKLKFSELHSANDWWWAVDNLALTGIKDLPGLKLVGVSGSEGDAPAATDETLFDVNPTTGAATQIVKLPSIPGSDAIAFNPATGLLHHISGGSSTSDTPSDPTYRDNHFMETLDVASGSNTQHTVYNANSPQFGPAGPMPSFVLPATRRTDAQTDPSFGTAAGPGEYALANDLTWSDQAQAFYVGDANGIYKLTADGQSTFIGNPLVGGEGIGGIVVARVDGQQLLFVAQRDAANMYQIDPATGDIIGDTIAIEDAGGTPYPGLLSMVESPDGSGLYALARDPADRDNPLARKIVKVDIQLNPDDVSVATVTPIATVSAPIEDLAFVYLAAAPPAAAVSQVFVNGPGITGQTSANGVAFRTLAGIDATYGYPVPGGTNQTKSIPWSNGINKISLRFTQDVASQLQKDDLVVRGVNSATYAISDFSYDPGTKTGTWTLTNPIVNDKVRLFLDDALVGGLDGEWADGADTFPSGNGTPGGDFAFQIHVLRGDANQDGQVSALDLGQLKSRLNRNATTNQGSGTTGYNVFADLNADGQINAQDLGIAKLRLNSRLPTGDPATALLFSTRPVSQ